MLKTLVVRGEKDLEQSHNKYMFGLSQIQISLVYTEYTKWGKY